MARKLPGQAPKVEVMVDAGKQVVPRARDPLIPCHLAALIRCRHQPDQGAEFATIADLPPPEDLRGHHPRPAGANRPQRL